MKKILAIETSCDETALALVECQDSTVTILDHVLYSQIDDHGQYGGVVPGLAARIHGKKLPQMIIDFLDHNQPHLDYIAVTSGPGLEPALHVGVNQARVLATALNIPLLPVNHMHGHMFSSFLSDTHVPRKDEYPFLAMTLSGGHTEFVLVQGYNQYRILGQTIDDAVGEAFDKVGTMLGLGYPGGPAISRLAVNGDPEAITFPRPMIGSSDGRMSFSGLKTAVKYYIQDHPPETEQKKADIAASFEQAVIDVIIKKLTWILDRYFIVSIRGGGGVWANPALRKVTDQFAQKRSIPLHLPSQEVATDNAQMIGYIAALDLYYGVNRELRVEGKKAL